MVVNLRTALKVAIVMLVGLFVASIAGCIVGGIMQYPLAALNSSGIQIPSSYNYPKSATGSLCAAAGMVLVIVVAVGIIVLLIMAFERFFQGSGRQILGDT